MFLFLLSLLKWVLFYCNFCYTFYMNKPVNKLIIISLLGFLSFSGFSYAQSVSKKSVQDSKVEVSFPVEKDDFLLFYGVTQDENTDAKINDLRKDFISKFEDLKSEYKASLTDIVKDKNLIPQNESVKKDAKPALKSASVSVKQVKSSPKKSTGQEKEEIIINPIVNMVDSQSVVHTENSSWFKKVKSFFGW